MGEINNDNSFVFDTFAFNYSNDVVQNQQAMKQKGEKAKKDHDEKRQKVQTDISQNVLQDDEGDDLMG